MAIIYVDVVFILNLIIDYLLLYATSKMLKKDVGKLMLLGGAVIGASYTILMLCINYTLFSNFIVKVIFSMVLIKLTFGNISLKGTLRAMLMFYFVNFAFCGGIYAVASMLGMNDRYITFGIFTLYSLIAYVLLMLASKYRLKLLNRQKVKLVVGFSSVEREIDCIVDTGNCLYTPFSGKPVIVAEKNIMEGILPVEFPLNESTKPIVIPFNSVGCKNGVIYGFRPDYAYFLINGKRQKIKRAVIGIYDGELSSDGNYNGLINPVMIA